LAILYISYELGRELKMMNKVIEAVRLETGNKLSVLEARPMVHMIMGYLFAEQVIQENQ
jgi:hypothetical protein